MLLATGLLMEFAKFLQIISWIMLPVLLAIIAITIFFHYRRKRRKDIGGQHPLEDILSSPTDDHDTSRPGAYVLFDHSGLIRQYKNKLSYNHAKYTALKHDFEKLERKYRAIADGGKPRFVNLKNNDMENTPEQLMNKMADEYAAEKKELLTRIEQLDRSYKSLEAENESLLEQVGMQSATDEDKEIIVNRWKEENAALRTELQEKVYLADMLEEKKAQIEFLQNQVEQRIKNFHQAERQREEARQETERIRRSYEQHAGDIQSLKDEAIQKENEANECRRELVEKEREIRQQQELLLSKNDHITYLGNVLQEVKQQNEMLNAAVADGHDRAAVLQQQVEDERSRLVLAEQRLAANKQLLHRLYKEFAACMEDESQSPPVVSLRPAYISKASEEEWDETAVK
jgi:chromosome segregation ATPase